MCWVIDVEGGIRPLGTAAWQSQQSRKSDTRSHRTYDTARPGTLQLLPNEARIKDLRAEYRDMAPVMFDKSSTLF